MKHTMAGYYNWLLDIMIRCGIGEVRDSELPWDYLNTATQLGHIVYGNDEGVNFVAYTLTPEAVNFIKENE